MTKQTVADLDTTTSNNTDILGQSTLGTADAKDLDAVDRSILALLARFYADLGGVVTVGGSANAITITSASTYQALENGLIISFKAGSANTTAATLNLDGLGAKAIRSKGDTALVGGEIAANGRYMLQYDEAYNSAAGAWVLLNPSTLAVLVGDSGSGGTKGIVPAPAAGDAASGKLLRADGTWGAAKILLGTLTTTSGTTTSAVTIPDGFRKLYIEIESLSTNGAAGLLVELSSTAGVAWGSAGSIRSIGGGADILNGWAEIGGILSTVAAAKTALSVIAVDTSLSVNSALTPTNTAARANAIRFSLSANSFDAGTIRVYGVP